MKQQPGQQVGSFPGNQAPSYAELYNQLVEYQSAFAALSKNYQTVQVEAKNLREALQQSERQLHIKNLKKPLYFLGQKIFFTLLAITDPSAPYRYEGDIDLITQWSKSMDLFINRQESFSEAATNQDKKILEGVLNILQLLKQCCKFCEKNLLVEDNLTFIFKALEAGQLQYIRKIVDYITEEFFKKGVKQAEEKKFTDDFLCFLRGEGEFFFPDLGTYVAQSMVSGLKKVEKQKGPTEETKEEAVQALSPRSVSHTPSSFFGQHPSVAGEEQQQVQEQQTTYQSDKMTKSP